MQKWRTNKYSCCQLVSAINAGIFLGLDDISDELFEELAEEVFCVNGAALKVEKVFPKIGLIGTTHSDVIPTFAWFKNNLPISITYRDPEYGRHSALIIGTYQRGSCDKGFYLVGAYKDEMSFGEMCERLGWHSHQLRFVTYQKLDK